MQEFPATRGVIYILSNPSIPSVLKIGQTTRNAVARARELSRPTGVPTDFEVVYEVIVSDISKAEARIHFLLDDTRVNRKREFFRVDPARAIQLLKNVALEFPVNEEKEADGAEILPDLDRRMRRWLRPDLVSVRFVQFSDLCIIKYVVQPDLRSPEAIETIFDLRGIGDYDAPDGELFSPTRKTFDQNKHEFLILDPYSMIMTGLKILSPEAEDYVAFLWEKCNVEPPLESQWAIHDVVYDLWGTATDDEDELRILQQVRERTQRPELNRLF
ncbi:GIY-YIG nuclease family protein [Embleya sp. NPDC055664]